MRLGWAILISPEQTYVQQHIILLLGCIEILRRSMWAIFRVEWEWIKIQKKNIDQVGITDEKESDDNNNNNNNNGNNDSELAARDGLGTNHDSESHHLR